MPSQTPHPLNSASILYEDEALMVLNKPSGMPSHPLNESETETAVSVALAHFPGLRDVGDKRLEAGLLHRLDTATSGLLAFAKRKDEFTRLRKLWGTAAIKKFYRAIVCPAPNSKEHDSSRFKNTPFTLDDPIAHSAKSSKKMIVLLNGRRTPKSAIRGKPQPALTRVLSAHPIQDGAWDLSLQIETGVRHQIRVHCAAMGFPILGDPVYRASPSTRLWLHSWKLSLTKSDGSPLEIQCPLPADWPK